MTLAAAAGLLIVSFLRVMAVDKGFNSDHVVTFQLSLEGQYDPDRRVPFHAALLEKIRFLPGVVSAGLTSQLPLQGETWVSELRRPRESSGSNLRTQANYRYISPGYFHAAGTPVRSGRAFEDADRTRQVTILSETAARRVFPGENPVGQTIEFKDDGGPRILDIIGVAADVKTTRLEADAPPIVYLPYWRITPGGASYVVRASAEDKTLIAGIREAAAAVGRDVPIHHIRTMSEIVDTAVASRRLQTWLAGTFASAGVLLTCLGVFGVVSYGVSRRTAEIGVRMALGATPGEVVLMVVRESLRPVLIGVASGTLCALALGPLVASQLYGVQPNDPWVLGAIGALICIAAAGAAYWPARRGARIDPMNALRWE